MSLFLFIKFLLGIYGVLINFDRFISEICQDLLCA